MSLIVLLGAKAAEPYPEPFVPCGETDQEFHTYRPYQASPCNEGPGFPSTKPVALLCGNDVVFKETFTVNPGEASTCTALPGGGQHCSFKKSSTVNIAIDLSNAELPILGNTEDVPNHLSNENNLDSAERVNNYLSWYLNGVIVPGTEEDRTQFDTSGEGLFESNLKPEYINKLVNYSGPLRKLLPWGIQARKRIETIERAAAQIQHNQIVGCTTNTPIVNIIGDAPVNCYFDTISGFFRDLLPDFKRRLLSWTSHFPPLEENYEDTGEFWRARSKWRGALCSPQVLGWYLCSNLRAAHFWAELFQYVPFTSMEDSKGYVELVADDFAEDEEPTFVAQPNNQDIKITSLNFSPIGDNKKFLYFPHTQEAAQLGEMLQETFAPQEAQTYSGASGDGAVPYPTDRCEVLESRSNPGDDLFGEYFEEGDEALGGQLTYSTEFTCDFPAAGTPDFCRQNCGDEEACYNDCLNSVRTCQKEATVAAGSVYTRVPNAEEIWERFVNGSFSAFKRIFPKTGPDTPVTEIKDIPAVTTATYSASGGEGGAKAYAGDPAKNRSGENAQIYFAHLGSVSEYFLNGIQTALRPKGFSNQPISGAPPSTSAPGQSGSGSCKIIEGDAPYCSVGYLTQYYGNRATTFSQICNRESGANPNIVNRSCLNSSDNIDNDGDGCIDKDDAPGKTNAQGEPCTPVRILGVNYWGDGATIDYSIGLYQINALAHCPEAISYTSEQMSDGGVIISCNILNNQALQSCENTYTDPITNIQKAVELSGGGISLSPWAGSAALCGLQ